MAPKGFMGKKASPSAVSAYEETCVLKREELVARHAKELETYLASPAPVPSVQNSLGVEPDDTVVSENVFVGEEMGGGVEIGGESGGGAYHGKLSRKDRRLAKQKHLEAPEQNNGDKNSSAESVKERELLLLNDQLQPGLRVHAIAADGNCLYRAISDQLSLLADGNIRSPEFDHRTLRARAAEFIRAYWDEFAPFLPYEPSDMYPESGVASEVKAAVSRYCDRMSSSNSWGGHPEIRALANVLACRIVVFRVGALPLIFTPRGEEETGDGTTPGRHRKLSITYHAHFSASGEHYNSARPSTIV